MKVKKRIKPIFIVHFNPIEIYPPVMNTIRFFEKKGRNIKINVFTTSLTGSWSIFNSKTNGVKISRLGKSGGKASLWNRLYSYLFFNSVVLLKLMVNRPSAIVYYETISAFSPLLYKKWFNRSVKVYIHYHEYTSVAEYDNGMWQVKQFHKMEKVMYPFVNWISHTNENRMEMFEGDNENIQLANKQVMPNYPPAEWKRVITKKPANAYKSIRVVYTGSLGLSTMYLKEFAWWIKELDGKMQWDIYSYNAGEEVRDFLIELNCRYIRLLPAVDYYSLPDILSAYDVGVILYRGSGPNWVYNIPNKLFEYHVCGLDVWYPSEMISPDRYKTGDEYPQIIKLDFNNLTNEDPDELVDRANKCYHSRDFNADMVLEKFYLQVVAESV